MPQTTDDVGGAGNLRADRRTFLRRAALFTAGGLTAYANRGGAAALALPTTTADAAAALGSTSYTPEQLALAEDAFIFGVPIVLMDKYLTLADTTGYPRNRLSVSLELSTPTTFVDSPNVDTLYGDGWIDLSQEPQVISVPNTHNRYYSIQLMDMWSNTFAYIGRRATGTQAGAFVLTPPGWKGKIPRHLKHLKQIKSPTTRLLALARTFVGEPSELPTAQRIHTSYKVGPLSKYPRHQLAPVVRANALNNTPNIDLTGSLGTAFYERLNELIREYPPNVLELSGYLPTLAPIRVGPQFYGQATGAIGDAQDESISPGIAAVNAEYQKDVSEVNVWYYLANIVPFIQDHALRAAAVFRGPGAHINQEALYFAAKVNAADAPFVGATPYTLTFPAGQTPPVNSFWSLTMYDSNTQLYPNELNRYAISDRTPGIQYADDGSLEFIISYEKPLSGTTNWLPAPEHEYSMILRTYQPGEAILNGSYELPGLKLGTTLPAPPSLPGGF